MNDLDTKLQLIAKHAPKLRAAGVQALTVDGVSLQLAPHEEPAGEIPAATAESHVPNNPADDHLTYGLEEGARLPGFTRPIDL
jgi:hypothetical protein